MWSIEQQYLCCSEKAMLLRNEEEEVLFEKALTPSDVGKLNRLVIPKQHAEKHLPLKAENGLLLGFEDEVGKSWRFRYSYWNSSQSYVLTKGWSRFVKDKRLHAGDIVVFARHRLHTARLFIRSRTSHHPLSLSHLPTAAAPPPATLFYQTQSPPPPAASAAAAGGGSSSGSSGNSKTTVRLFGVNLECCHDSDPHPLSLPHQQYYSSNHHMDISFSGGAADADQQMYIAKDKIWEM